MWNFFSRESFPYELTQRVDVFNSYSVFSLNDGCKKNSGEKVSIFTYYKKPGTQEFLEHANATLKKLKTLKHPSILQFINSYEDDNYFHIVTNHCTPLLTYLTSLDEQITMEKENKEMYLKCGLASIGEAVAFLNHADLRHNNIFHGSVFVNDDGLWQLGEVGYITNLKSNYPQKLIEKLRKYDPPEELLKLSPGCVDDWGLSILLWESFNDELASNARLSKPQKIPSDLSAIYFELQHQTGSVKETVSSLINSCTSNNVLFNTLDALNNYHLKERDIKAKISTDLLELLPNIPQDIVLNKILTLLKQAYEFDSDNSAYLVPIFAKMHGMATEKKYQDIVENYIVRLFTSNDRATRLALLMNLEHFIDKITKKSVNEMFPNLSAGFLDSNAKIRGETVKAMVLIAPKLSTKNLNDESMRLLLSIQANDQETYLRTNATICLGKIAYTLQPSTRRRLLNAFMFTFRDRSISVRNAGIQAFAVTHRFFTIEEIAKHILPGLVLLTIDVDLMVRENAFKTIKVLLSKLEQVSQSPELKETIEKDVNSETCENSTSWSSWAFTAITSKFYTPSEKKPRSDILENKTNAGLSTGIAADADLKNASEDSPTKSSNLPQCVSDKPIIVQQSSDSHSSESEMSDVGVWNGSEVIVRNTNLKNKQQDIVPNKRSSGPMKLGTRQKM